MKTLLIVGAGIEQIPTIEIAKKMGLRVVVSDGSPHAPAIAYADDHIIASTYDPKGTARAARIYSDTKHKLDGVITVATDVPITVSTVAKALGLPGNSVATAKRAMDKLLMKRVFKKHNVAIPPFAPVRTKDLERFIKTHSYPVVVKPVDSRGARGVQRLVQGANVVQAIEVARKESPTHRVMVEKFLPGPQYSTESVIYDGKIYTTGLSLRNYEHVEKFAPYFIEDGGDLVVKSGRKFPLSLSPAQKKELDSLLVRAAHAMGIVRGSIKGDIVYSNGRFAIVEIAARVSGGYFATIQAPLSNGTNLVGAVIQIALGKKPDKHLLQWKYEKGVSQRFFFPSTPGTVEGVSGIERIKRMPEVKRLYIYVKKDDVVHKTVSHPSRLGCVITCAPTSALATAAAKRAVAALHISVA